MAARIPTILLIHGSWLGGWCWRPVRDALARKGLASSAPTLTGLGDRAHLGGPATGLQAHVADVVEHLHFLDGDDVVIVGHSYGSAVAAEVAALRPDLVRLQIALDGFTLAPGQSVFGRHPELEPLFAALISADAPDLVQPPDSAFLGLPDTADTARLMARLRPTPACVNREARRPGQEPAACERHYVRFTGFPFFEETARLAAEAGWRTSAIDAGHMAIVTHAEAVADRIAAIVAGRA
ncbi:alpha/beta hydrolase [Rhizorhabdus histidinilytica]|uniref:Pimeloyl-ACP methyl ester carboxylesterase n=1 Tax=Rhizorhabdus histidinilytica TaxID=439228 RepID=A0A1T5G9Q9_9SPHN|nr:alpha/beta hydrolase [Rhizorhabdus histidinilytica]SKC05233.1 Pimeloyl-ACP methyl ester carboxylesterase [Rhizorhabdus histidinilytica]